MTLKRAENSIEIRAYIKASSLLGLKPAAIHRDVFDIYGEEQMSHRSVLFFSTSSWHFKKTLET